MALFSRVDRFSGADIVATINGEVIGEIQNISYTARPTQPVFEMGSPGPSEPTRIYDYDGMISTLGEPSRMMRNATITISDPIDLSSLMNAYSDSAKLFFVGDNFEFEFVEPKNNAEAKGRLRKGDL